MSDQRLPTDRWPHWTGPGQSVAATCAKIVEQADASHSAEHSPEETSRVEIFTIGTLGLVLNAELQLWGNTSLDELSKAIQEQAKDGK